MVRQRGFFIAVILFCVVIPPFLLGYVVGWNASVQTALGSEAIPYNGPLPDLDALASSNQPWKTVYAPSTVPAPDDSSLDQTNTPAPFTPEPNRPPTPSPTPRASSDALLLVTLFPNHLFTVNDAPATLPELRAQLVKLAKKPVPPSIILSAKPGIPYEDILQLLQICKENHLTSVNIQSSP